MQAELQTMHANIEKTADANRAWHSRASIRVILDDSEGHVGLGEAAPLPGLSPETSREAYRALESFSWPDRPLRSRADISEAIEAIDASLPSARFAAEAALSSLAASLEDVPLYALYSSEVSQIPLALTLFGRDEEAVLRSAREAKAFEAGAVALSIGSRPWSVELDLLARVRRIVGPVQMRVDAAESLPTDRLAERLQELAELGVDLVVDPAPLAHVSALPKGAVALGVRRALREDDEVVERALEAEAVDALVIAPSLVGGLERSVRLAERARARGRRVVVSHLLEGVVARAAAAHLALAVGGEAAELGDHPALYALSDGLMAPWIDLASIEPPAMHGLALELAW